MTIGAEVGDGLPVRDRRTRAPDRDTILSVAATLFEARGYRATTMQDLADELNISKATLYAHAKSKSDVLVGIIEQWTRLMEADLEKAMLHSQPVERVRDFLRLWIQRSVSMRAHRTVFALCASDHELGADVSVQFRNWEDTMQDRVQALVVLAQKLGVVRSEINPTVAALNLINAPHWAADRLVEPGVLDEETAVEQIMDVVLFGLFAPDAPAEIGLVQPDYQPR